MSHDRSSVESVVQHYFDALYEGDADKLGAVFHPSADLRSVDLSIDPNDRPYGSLFGRRPDLTNYGLIGFGRFTTPAAWLSTWSAVSTNADFLRCGPGVTAPTLFIELTGRKLD